MYIKFQQLFIYYQQEYLEEKQRERIFFAHPLHIVIQEEKLSDLQFINLSESNSMWILINFTDLLCGGHTHPTSLTGTHHNYTFYIVFVARILLKCTHLILSGRLMDISVIYTSIYVLFVLPCSMVFSFVE